LFRQESLLSLRLHAPGLARLVLATLLASVAAVPAAHAVEDYDEVVEIFFPTDPSVSSFSDDYDSPRGGGSRVHMATDIIVPKHTPEYAAADGVICYITGVDSPEPSWGYNLKICGDDGVSYGYIHINNDTPGTDDGEGGVEHAYGPGIVKGVRVTAGQLVAYAGDSGNAEGSVSHLHFEMEHDDVNSPYDTTNMNPYPSLTAAIDDGRTSDGSGEPTAEPTARPQRADSASRVAGKDRVATALAVAAHGLAHAETVVLARSEVPWPAIVAGPLAAIHGGAVLTTAPDQLDARVLARIKELGVTRVYAVGPLDFDLREALDDSGVTEHIVLDDGDRYATSALVAEVIWDATLPPAEPGPDGQQQETGAEAPRAATREAVLALGEHADPSRSWPDALMASYYGSARFLPVLLTPADRADRRVADALVDVEATWVIGGPGAISQATLDQFADGTRSRFARLAGDNRYATALAVVDDLVSRKLVHGHTVWVATGHNWPDATVAGPIISAERGLLVLMNGTGAGGDQDTRAWLTSRAEEIDTVTALGGPAAISPEVLSMALDDIT
jgi:putative cell wall-binding protein